MKPHILATFGDVALAVGCNFKKYSEIVLQCLQQASQAQVDKVNTAIELVSLFHQFFHYVKQVEDFEPLV